MFDHSIFRERIYVSVFFLLSIYSYLFILLLFIGFIVVFDGRIFRARVHVGGGARAGAEVHPGDRQAARYVQKLPPNHLDQLLCRRRCE